MLIAGKILRFAQDDKGASLRMTKGPGSSMSGIYDLRGSEKAYEDHRDRGIPGDVQELQLL